MRVSLDSVIFSTGQIAMQVSSVWSEYWDVIGIRHPYSFQLVRMSVSSGVINEKTSFSLLLLVTSYMFVASRFGQIAMQVSSVLSKHYDIIGTRHPWKVFCFLEDVCLPWFNQERRIDSLCLIGCSRYILRILEVDGSSSFGSRVVTKIRNLSLSDMHESIFRFRHIHHWTDCDASILCLVRILRRYRNTTSLLFQLVRMSVFHWCDQGEDIFFSSPVGYIR